MPPRPSSDPTPTNGNGLLARLGKKGWAAGFTGLTVVVILLLFGAMSANRGNQTLTQAQTGAGFARTVLPSSTPVPTLTFTSTPGPGTPTAVSNVACPTTGCPFTDTPTCNCTTDQIYYGQTPQTPDQGTSKPVLLFVHGLTGIAADWWSAYSFSGVNDMYLLAYNAGYRTAFVTLQPGLVGGCYCARGPDFNYFTNGSNLATMIGLVRTHYGVKQVDIIAHSKGGLDAQWAIWGGNGSADQVDTLFMLSTPNLGSYLANIECTPSPTTLSAICGLEPQYLNLLPTPGTFRNTVDANIRRSSTKLYVAGGTDHGPPGSILSSGGSFLNQYGSNDGFVNVFSAITLTQSHYLDVHTVNHDSIRIGHVSWPAIQSVLEAGTPVATPTVSSKSSANSVSG